MPQDEQTLVQELRALQKELWTSEYLMKITEFDGSTIAPVNSAEARAEAMSALSEQHHRLLTGPSAREVVGRALSAAQAGTLTGQAADEARVLARDQHEACAIPTQEAADWTRLTCEAQAVWHQAKNKSDWDSFAPYVDRIVETLRRHAGYLDNTKDPYDVWLDRYERGMSTADYDAFFAQVKNTVVPLVHEIQQKGTQPSAEFLSSHVPEAAQRSLSFDLMQLVGLNLDDTCLAFTEHPFSEGFSAGDARVATHIYEDNALSNVYSVIHEAGHAIYELGSDPAYAYTCLAGGTSMGIHESQSRFFENTIGRSRAFMNPLLQLLRKACGEVYDQVDEETLYRAVNIAQPSLIRTEADELTYPLHIMIRYEIERLLFAGDAVAADIPELWAQLTQSYLGLEVPNHALGCLQDVHWSGGSFGYFPTYALGSAYDAQYLDTMAAEGIDVAAACATGDLAPVRSWLSRHIWHPARSRDAAELIEQACKKPFDASYYCTYLDTKFRELYQL